MFMSGLVTVLCVGWILREFNLLLRHWWLLVSLYGTTTVYCCVGSPSFACFGLATFHNFTVCLFNIWCFLSSVIPIDVIPIEYADSTSCRCGAMYTHFFFYIYREILWLPHESYYRRLLPYIKEFTHYILFPCVVQIFTYFICQSKQNRLLWISVSDRMLCPYQLHFPIIMNMRMMLN